MVAVAVIMQLSAEIICKGELLLRLQNGNLGNKMATVLTLLNISLFVKAAHLEKRVDVALRGKWLVKTHSCYFVSPCLQATFSSKTQN